LLLERGETYSYFLFQPEDRGSRFLENVDKFLPEHTVSHLRKEFSSHALYRVLTMASFSLTGITLLEIATDFNQKEVRNICYPSTLVRQVFGHGVDK
jgi:hypothetical protein